MKFVKYICIFFLLITLISCNKNAIPDQTGTPDPKPRQIEGYAYYPEYDASTLTVYATSPGYSISNDQYALITVLDTAPQRQLVPVQPEVNIEKWTGKEWQRMIYSGLSFDFRPDTWVPGSYVWSGEAEQTRIELANVIDPSTSSTLRPGRYRAVLYVGYEFRDLPYELRYAEFVLTE